MMRRGTLADHDVASVLRQAAAERLSGQIDIDGDRPAILYIADGELSLACWADDEVVIAVDDDADDATYSAAILTEERRLRAASRDVLGLVLDRDDGWYHHHPLGEHRAAALWSWPVEEVLAEVAVRAHRPSAGPARPGASDGADAPSGAGEPPDAPRDAASPDAGALAGDGTRPRDGAPPPSAPAPPVDHRAPAEEIAARRGGADRPDGTRPMPPSAAGGASARDPFAAELASPNPPPTTGAPLGEAATEDGPSWRLAPTTPVEPLDEAAWSVVVALAGVATEAEIVERLGWPAVKAEIVLRSLEARGVVVAASSSAPPRAEAG